MNVPPPLTTRQEEILDHTLALLREQGLARLTMKKVATRVGFTEPALYRHYATKEELLLGVLGRLEGMLLGPARQIAAERSAPASVRLGRVVTHHAKLLLATDGLPILLFAEFSATGQERPLARMRGILKAYVTLLAGLLREARGSRPGPAPEELAYLFLGIGVALGLRRRLLPEAELEQAEVERLLHFVIAGVAAAGEGEEEK